MLTGLTTLNPLMSTAANTEQKAMCIMVSDSGYGNGM